jgi:predicted permease
MAALGWWRRLTKREELEAGLDQEIQFHLEQQIAKNIKQGMTPEAARRAAIVRFGGVERARESARDEFRAAALEDLSRDLQYGARTLARAPGFALVSMLTLGLGIGAATAVFSVVNGVLVRPLPYPAADRIVRLFQIDKDGNRGGNISEPNYNDWKSETRSYASMAETSWRGQVSVLGGSEPTRATVTYVSREFFDVMRVRPLRGRLFAPDEQMPGANPVVLVSEAYWKRWLAGRPDFTAQTLRFGQRVYQIVGILPASFDYPFGTEIWVPRELDPPQTARTAHNFQVVARLRDGVSVEQAARELSTVSRAMKSRYGDETWMSDATVVRLQDQLTASAKPALYVLMAASALLLLIACANVSNLLLARAATRRRELAVRLALGAGRWRITRQLMAESLVLCAAGGGLGVLLAIAGVKLLLRLEASGLPRVSELSVDWVALIFAVSVSLVLAIVLGLATTMRAGRQDLRSYLSEAQRTTSGTLGAQRIRDGLVVTQVALTLIVLAGAGLLARSFLLVLAVDPGFRINQALVVDLALPESPTPDLVQRQRQFQEEVLARLSRVPGVTGVALTSDFPLGGGYYPNGQFIEMTRPDEIQSYEQFRALPDIKERAGFAGYRVVSEDYFRTMGIPLIRGRVFETSDAPDAAHVAVISESLAQTKWPNQDPIGRFVQFGNMDGDIRGFRVVGIVGDIREQTLEAPPSPLFYGYYRQRHINGFSVVMQGERAASAALEAQRIVRQLNPDLPVRTRTMEQAFERTLAGRRFSLILLAVFGAAALGLATMGIYGVISYLVAQRSREISIRMALGAKSVDLLGMIIGRGARLALIGTIIGLAVALASTRLLKGMLYGISAADPAAFGAVIGLIAAAVLVATYVPARRAMMIAPNATLRTE